ncbi:ABC transporter ATP-binding protein [Stappia indica]|uniref:ABC transporter ATP-binding protein n=1 Tax=Stappia indica TaxID=538381 RepID=UPI001CD4BDCC|nr:ABC transporter ATP-binding protein [Stappia indica]MCA1298532.1 ABC transporter ATP-binding protein [Stappia indica]
MARVDLQNVTKDWGTAVAVDDISLDLKDGEFVAVLGPSGCGKSTTLFMLAGIYAPSSGDIRFDGARVNDVEARDRNVGIVFQSYALYPNMTVLQNILFPLRFQKVPRTDAEREAREIARLVQIENLLDRRPGQLSGGQQQRVALARALVKKPNLLLLDEPLSNLDATLRLSMRAEIRRIQRELGVTTILVTHDQIEATTMADRIICMNAGRVEQIGTPTDLYRAPETTFVAAFIGSPPINLIDARLAGDTLEIGDKRLRATGAGTEHGGPVKLGLRPEHIREAATGLAATITASEPMGRETLYTADTPIGSLHFLEATSMPRLAPGAKLSLTFDGADSLVFDAATTRLMHGVCAHV